MTWSESGVLAAVAFILLAGCATSGPQVDSAGKHRGTPGHYSQSTDSATNGCLRNPACYTQQGDEAVLPWVSSAARAARTVATVMQFLEDADVKLVEQLLLQCSKDADFQVNPMEFVEGLRPTDVVIHESGNPNKVQCVYDYKFPCLTSRRASPGWRYSSRSEPDQGDRYKDALGGEAGPFLVSPLLGVQ